jgi:hypothetical protein
VSNFLLHCCLLQVAAAVKGLSMADILAYEKSGSIELAGHTLGEGDVKVKSLLCLTIISCFGGTVVCITSLKHAKAARCTMRVVPGGVAELMLLPSTL